MASALAHIIEDVKGQSTALAVLLVAAMLMFSMFAIDFGMMWLERTRQADMLQQSEAACMEPAVSLKVKNSMTPGRDMCAALAGQLRASGFKGSIEAYYYELGPADGVTDEASRAYAFGATVSGEVPLTFAALAGVTLPTIQSRTWTHAKFYSSEKVWRPPSSSNGRLMVDAGKPVSSGTWTSCSSANETMMPGVGAALEKARLSR